MKAPSQGLGYDSVSMGKAVYGALKSELYAIILYKSEALLPTHAF